MMDALLNILGLIFLVTGIITWLFVCFVTWYYWLCKPNKEK